MSGVLVCVGNPLLDIATVVDHEYLTKYDIKAGAAYLAEEKHMPIYDEIVKKYKVEYIAGGAAQNSARVAQWLLGPGRKNFTCYIGCIGNDDNGRIIKSATESAGVETHYLVDTANVTGTCAVLIAEKERCLMTNLGAANHYKKSHMESAEMQAVIERAKFFYATGYFLTVSPESYEMIGQHAAQHNKVVLFGLAAPFVIQFFYDKLSLILPYVDVVFSNDDEARTLGEKCGWGTDIAVIAEKLSSWEKKNTKRQRVVIFTQGAKPTLVFENGKITEHAVAPVKAEDIIDTNGAGDSFVGGFLSGFILGRGTEECVKLGHYAASEVIKRSSCTYPEQPAMTL